MTTLKIALVILLTVVIGCSSELATRDHELTDTVDPISAEVGEDSSSDGWIEFVETIGDESEVAMRLTPGQPLAGRAVKLEVKAGSVYGRFRGKVWARVNKPSDTWTTEAGGDDWVAMSETGGLIMDLQTHEMVPLGSTEELPREEQPGETHYETELVFPAAGKGAVDLKFFYDYPGEQPMAFQAWQGDVSGD